MKRRDLLKFISASGLVIPSWGWVTDAKAQSSGYTGRILINVMANGGLDQSSWADPRETDRTINTWAVTTPAGVAGTIRYAPIANNRAFFERYFQQMLVINGVHGETNGHTEGARVHATGKLDMGYPNVAELFASVNGRGLPLAYLAAGGFNTSVGLRAPAPMPDANSFRALVSPNSASASNDFMKQSDLDRTQAARAERMRALAGRAETLPRTKTTASEFVASADSRALMQRVAALLPATFDQPFSQAHVGLVAAQAGIACTMQLSTGGFDAHSNIDNSYANSLPRLTDMVDYIWQKSAQLGIDNRIFVRIFSDLGRAPRINSGNGKDHWSVGTTILMEKSPAWGNRVFGASGPKHEQTRINTTTGAVDPTAGVVIRPRHVHAALRNYLNIETTDPRFDLKVPANETFDFFNPAASTGYPNL
jgi:uncharacterized protein (DUF1501 family)